MKRLAAVLALVVMSPFGFAQEEGDVEARGTIRKRLRCESPHMAMPYVDLNGILTIDEDSRDFDNARGRFRVSFGSGMIHHVEVRGRYVKNGNIEQAELKADRSSHDVTGIYIDFSGRGFSGHSYVERDFTETRRMNCFVGG